MTDETGVAQEATEKVIAEVVTDETASEATENTEGQEDPPASEEEKTSAAKERRERRKAHEQKLREDTEAARRDAEHWRARAERLKNTSGEPPKEAEFSDPIEYAAALGAYKARQSSVTSDAALLDEDAKAADAKAAALEGERLRQRQEVYAEDREQAKARYADLDQVLAVAANPAFVSNDLAMMVLESDQPVDLAYHLGKNPALALQLSQMHPISAARELGRIEASLSRPQQKTQTAAPPPVTPIRGRATPGRNPETMSYAEYKAWRSGK